MMSKLILTFALVTLSLSGSEVNGQEAPVAFYGVSETSGITPGSEFDLTILIDSTMPLNAYELVLRYSPETLEVVRLNNANSLIDVWQREPSASERGVVRWTGGSFEPFSGTGGEILRITFKTLAVGEAAISFETAEAYTADGKGTRAEAASRDLAFAVQAGSPLPPSGTGDQTPPEIQTVSFDQDPFNPNQKLLSFLARDRESGVKESEARYRVWFTWSDWQPAQNPVAFPPNAWSVALRVKDNFGNQTAQVVYHWPALLGNFSPMAIAGLVLVAYFVIRNKRKTARAPQ